MFKYILFSFILLILNIDCYAQITAPNFGKGLRITAADSSFYLKMGFRFQNLVISEWDVVDGSLTDNHTAFMVRRARLKFDGWAVTPKLKYKFELGLSNRDIGNGTSTEFNRAANVILDAYVKWNFHRNFHLQFGQGKLPGNRERLISSGNLQFVDRSKLNSAFNIDRDMGVQLHHISTADNGAIFRSSLAVSQGEGRNVTIGSSGGFDYVAKLEFLPFGVFQSKGDYVGSAVKYEENPKLALAVSYDYNDNTVRSKGQLGSFVYDDEGALEQSTLQTIFVDLMYKHKNISIMAEYAKRDNDEDKDCESIGGDIVEYCSGEFSKGSAVNAQIGYMMHNNFEIAGRFTTVDQEGLNNYYTLGISKFIVGHKLKFQSDVTYSTIEYGNDGLLFRAQVDIHF